MIFFRFLFHVVDASTAVLRLRAVVLHVAAHVVLIRAAADGTGGTGTLFGWGQGLQQASPRQGTVVDAALVLRAGRDEGGRDQNQEQGKSCEFHLEKCNY